MNRGEAYRLSPLDDCYIYRSVLRSKAGHKIVDEHGAEDTFKTFTIEQVRPKIEVEDFWGWLCSVGKYVDAAGPSEITMNRTGGNTLGIEFQVWHAIADNRAGPRCFSDHFCGRKAVSHDFKS